MEDIFDQLMERDENKSDDLNSDNENNGPSDDKEERKRTIKVERRIVNKRPTLDVMRLTGSRGIPAIEEMSKNVLLKGKGHEREDLARIMIFLHYWTHRLYPKMTFEDCIEKIESLGKKRPTQAYLTKMRLGIIDDTDSTAATEDMPSEELIKSKQPSLTDEQKQRILKNRMIAQARRTARMQGSNRPSADPHV